ncbi:MAG: hypothetical protein H8Z69_05370 [Nanohaloarchaea archaeon]|nr:hypothetical protein [Candidatus Nanohaloarchaea archaeon]
MGLIPDTELDLDYYDKILGGIFLSLTGGTVAGYSTGIPLAYGVGAGGIVALILMYDGMFRNGPLG